VDIAENLVITTDPSNKFPIYIIVKNQLGMYLSQGQAIACIHRVSDKTLKTTRYL